MAQYPEATYTPRAKENRPGVSYEPERKTVGFVEDVTKLDDEVVAIENELGINPKGDYADVAARLLALENAGGGSNIILDVTLETEQNEIIFDNFDEFDDDGSVFEFIISSVPGVGGVNPFFFLSVNDNDEYSSNQYRSYSNWFGHSNEPVIGYTGQYCALITGVLARHANGYFNFGCDLMASQLDEYYSSDKAGSAGEFRSQIEKINKLRIYSPDASNFGIGTRIIIKKN